MKHGFAFDGANFVDSPTSDVLLTPGNFSIGGGFKLDKPKYYRGPVPSEYVLEADDLVVTMTDLSKTSDTLGYSALIPSKQGIRFLHNQRVGKVEVLRKDLVDKYFLHWLLRTPGYRREVLASASGTTVKHTAPSRVEAFQFNLPPLFEQRAIAAILGAVDDKIDLNGRMKETLEEMARAFFKSWFVDFDPVRANAEGRQPFGMDAATAALFPSGFESSELGEIPTGWKVEPLDGIASFLNGLALQKFPTVAGKPFLPVIKIAQLRAGAPDPSELADAGIPSQYVVEDGDILFSWSGSLLVDAWCAGRGALNQHLFKVTSDRFPKWFFKSWLDHHLSGFQNIAADKATTMGHIQRRHLTEARVIVPPFNVIEAAGKVLEALLDRTIASRVESRITAELRDYLLPKLLSGEVRVHDAEKAVEAVA